MGGKPQRLSPRVWTREGCTNAGRDIYRSILGNYVIERVPGHFVSPTEEERLEIKKLEWLIRKEKASETQNITGVSTGENRSD